MGDASSASVISVPKGGGAIKGIGETFTPDLHTGTGNFTVPIALPPGGNGFQPQLNLTYSTGNGNGLFGLGWAISLPGIARKTSKGIPRYRDLDPDPRKHDVFLLTGAEDLVATDATRSTYRPRVEGLFADIRHHIDAEAGSDYWEVRSKDGLSTYYGTNPQDAPLYPRSQGPYSDIAVIAKEKQSPTDRSRIFAWKITLTKDRSGTGSNTSTKRETSQRARSDGQGTLGISRCSLRSGMSTMTAGACDRSWLPPSSNTRIAPIRSLITARGSRSGLLGAARPS